MSPGTPQTLNERVSNKRKVKDQQGYRQEQQTWRERQGGAKVTFFPVGYLWVSAQVLPLP